MPWFATEPGHFPFGLREWAENVTSVALTRRWTVAVNLGIMARKNTSTAAAKAKKTAVPAAAEKIKKAAPAKAAAPAVADKAKKTAPVSARTDDSFIVKSYKIDLRAAESGLDAALGRVPTISVFDNKKAETANRYHGILFFHDEYKNVKRAGKNNKAFSLHYHISKFSLVCEVLDVYLPSGDLECYVEGDGGLRYPAAKAKKK